MSALVDDFVRDGFVVLRAAVPADLVERARTEIAAAMLPLGVDRTEPATWSAPVLRISCPESPTFAAAGTQPVLWNTYDALLGPSTWWKRQGVGGSVAARFPSETDPGDAGWHADSSYDGPDGGLWLNVASEGRGLLCLFLFSDVTDDDAPTEIKVGSHLDVPRLLAPAGGAGMSGFTLSPLLPKTTFERPSMFATGNAGDVFVCHPFLVHRATWPHRGVAPRLLAQPAVGLHEPFRLTGTEPYPVERMIRQALGR